MSTSRGGTRILKLIGSSMIVGLMLSAAQPVAARTNWRDWTQLGPENFPTRLSTIWFADWQLGINATDAIKMGNWTVSFGTATPVAWWETRAPDFWIIHIPLLCKNPTTADYNCTMNLVRFIPVSSWESNCSISITSTYSFVIQQCPSHLLLEDQKRRTRHRR